MKIKQAILISTLIPTCASGVLADPAVYDPFGYPAGGLAGATGGGEVGLSGSWNASADTLVAATNLIYGTLPTTGNSIGGLAGGINRFGGARTISASALAGNGLLNDGAELWFSVIMGYDVGGNVTNSRLAFALANSPFNSGNYKYYINDEGSQLGSGLGVTLGRFASTNGKIVATQFRDASKGNSGTAGNVFGTESAALLGAGQSRLVVGKINWGAASDSILIYVPDAFLNLGSPISTLSVAVNQSAYDTLTFARGDKVVMDEIRFGASYYDVAPPPNKLKLQVNTTNGVIKLVGGESQSVVFNSYQITSAASSLNPTGWTSLADQDYDGNGPVNGTGNGWEEAGGVSTRSLAEGYLLGDSAITAQTSVSVGWAYNTTTDARDLQFLFRSGTGQVLSGAVEYFSPALGDANGDHLVNQFDLNQIIDHWMMTGADWTQGDFNGDGVANQSDVNLLINNWQEIGAADLGALTGIATVPEPASLTALVCVAGLLVTARWSR